MMFPVSQLDTTPSSKAVEPVVWVRRLVILDSLQSKSKPIREIAFRRGLNIIATTEPSSRERRPVGHNVGKTLLTRLIRYCLGETHFASDSTRKAIAAVFPGGYVFAEIVLDGKSWAVARPIGSDKPSDAWCMQADSWQTLNDATEGYQAYTVFADLLNKTLTDQYGEFELPNVDKPAVWLNLLAWLSRDQYCRYRNPIEWRSAITGSNNPELSPEDSSLLIRMVMDVLDRTERQLAIDHKRLLDKHSTQCAKLKTMELSLSRDREFLKRRLEIDEDLLDDDLFSDAAKKCVESEKSSRSKKLEDLRQDEELKELDLSKSNAEEARVRIDQDLTRQKELQKLKHDEMKVNEEKLSDDVTDSLSSLLIPCEYPEERCDAKQRIRKLGRCNPLIQQRIDMLKDELTDIDRSLGQLKIELDQQEAKRDAAKAAYDKYKAKLDKRITEATESLTSINLSIKEVDAYVEKLKLVRKQTKAVQSLDRQIEHSRDSHATARGRVASKRKRLNDHFNRVLAALVGDDTQGTIDFDMKGLHLRLADRQAQQGEGLATAELVLSLDLACLSAGICGLGTHPRFLIHDSPREGDLELHIYHRLFEFILELERAFGKREPAFQYIVTTTTPPPKKLDRDQFQRLKLHRKSNAGLLLRTSF
jgi:uncharacterized protein YydD (DUF2326 family)